METRAVPGPDVAMERTVVGAVSADGAAVSRSGSGAGVAIGITVAIFLSIVVLVSLITVVILLTMGNQIANVFSNVVAALSTPSP